MPDICSSDESYAARFEPQFQIIADFSNSQKEASCYVKTLQSQSDSVYILTEMIVSVLEKIERLDILEQLHMHERMSISIVPGPISDRSVRICGDFNVTINPVLEVYISIPWHDLKTC